MAMLKEVDDSWQVWADEDNYETPDRLYNELCLKYQVFPKLDVCATQENRKCLDYITKEQNALVTEWVLGGKPVDIWVNAPGSIQLEFIARAESQYLKYNMNIMMIVPTRVMGTRIWDKYIEDDYNRKREYHRIMSRPVFLKNGRKTKFPAKHSYVVIIWRKV
jgi:site-specific DNA-methyltransferase (adenine-specific)